MFNYAGLNLNVRMLKLSSTIHFLNSYLIVIIINDVIMIVIMNAIIICHPFQYKNKLSLLILGGHEKNETKY